MSSSAASSNSNTNNYNSRMSPCPGYESSGLRGYSDLHSLQSDILDYHSSLAQLRPTSSPSSSNSPSSDTRSPSFEPSISASPSIFTYTPTIRTTRRPSPYPTSDIREPKKPTSSPAPTITMAIYNGGGGNENGGGESGEDVVVDDDMSLNLLPEEPGTFGANGTLPTDLNITNNDSNNTNITITGYLSGMPSMSPAPSSVASSNSSLRTKTIAAGEMNTNTLEEFINDRVLLQHQSSQQHPQLLRQRQQPSNSTTTAEAAMANNATTTTAPNPANAAAAKISFLICPNTILSFTKDTPPIILETPTQHPIEISCIAAASSDDASSSGQETMTPTSNSNTSKSSCVMSGGGRHIVMNYTPPPPGNDYLDDDEQASSSSSSMSSITISGIVFREATQTSIAINDPRGNIYFHDCAWENNSGEATMLIDGRYDDSTTTTPTSSSSDVDGGGDEIVGGDEVVGEDAEATDTSDPDNITMVTPSTVGSFADFILTTTTVSSSITTTPILDADATLSPFDVIDDDDQTMIQSTVKPPKDDDENNRRKLFLMEDVNEVGYNNVMMTMRDQALEESSLLGTRLLGANDAPLSTISINNCLFSGNMGNSSIIVSSKYEELLAAEQDLGSLETGGRHLQIDPPSTPKFAHWIHVTINGTSFTKGSISGSIIDNSGGRLQLSDCIVANNTAESIVKSQFGTLAMSSTEFDKNEVGSDVGPVLGDVGVVVLDAESSLELNEGNCISTASSPSDHCDGIDYAGVCIAFDSCDDATDVATGPCFSDWDDLVVAVRDRPNNEVDFIICPGAALIATATPVVINANGVTIQCGTPSSQSKNCFISGGYSHFHVEGSSSGVQLARLSMSASTGSNIMALGTADAKLTVRDCEFIMNEGTTAIIINSGESMSSSSSSADTTGAAASAAMSVEVVNCTFARNELAFGTIANNGGALSVFNSRFLENSGNGGNIVVMKRGTCDIEGSCFSLSSSVAPGTIFVEEGSVIIGNENNFGSENTAGGYADGSVCFDIFQQAKDADCLIEGSSKCTGSCKEFTASSCTLDTGDNSNVDNGISFPAFNKDGGPLYSKIVPITVSIVVCVLLVLGLIGITLRRRKSNVRRSRRRGTNRREYGEVDDGNFHY